MKYQLNRSDGGASILNLVSGDIAQVVAQWHDAHKAGNPEDTLSGVTILSYAEISDADIPASREYRNAWRAQ